MKFCVAVILIFATLVSAGPLFPKDLMDKAKKECAEEFEISLSEFVEKFKKEVFLPNNNSTSDHCFVKCVVTKLGIFDNNSASGFKLEMLNEAISKLEDNPFDEAMTVAVKCVKDTHQITNDCYRAYSGGKCFFKELIKISGRKDILSDPKYKKECFEELNLKVDKYSAYNLTDIQPKLPCYVKCLYEKEGAFDKDSGLKVEYLYNKISSDDSSGEYYKNFEKCGKDLQQGVNDCERAYRGEDCFFNEVFKLNL